MAIADRGGQKCARKNVSYLSNRAYDGQERRYFVFADEPLNQLSNQSNQSNKARRNERFVRMTRQSRSQLFNSRRAFA